MERKPEVGLGVAALVLAVTVGVGAAGALGSLAGQLLLQATPEELRGLMIGTGVGIALLGGVVGWSVWRIAQGVGSEGGRGGSGRWQHGTVARVWFERSR